MFAPGTIYLAGYWFLMAMLHTQCKNHKLLQPGVCNEDGGDGVNLRMVHQHPSSQVTLGSVRLKYYICARNMVKIHPNGSRYLSL